MRLISTLLLLAVAALDAHAADDIVFWPGVDHDPAIPTFEGVLGYAPGEAISTHDQARAYFDALVDAQPARVRLRPYAVSWEGRELFYVIIGAPDRIADLEGIRSAMEALADPRQTDADRARDLIASTPGITWLSYGVHGNEISSTDAAMLTAYHLLAARGDEIVDTILAESLVILDPMQNPDGRDRFIQGTRAARGLLADADRATAEHDERWPSGRVNHYTFDLNRDWLALTQPETRGRVAAILEWYPLVYVDAHEMGGDSTYYFAPEAVPYNPYIHPDQRQALELIGRNNARWFDRYGIDYFTREIFDAFYPGYGASWPLFFGAIATTYEQASTGGLVFRKASGRDFHYREAVRNHFVTSISTAEVVARNRETLLENFYHFRRDGIDAGRKGDVREYLIDPRPDASAADKLAALLVEHGAELRRSTRAFSACGEEYPAGTPAVSLSQPSHRLIRTLLDPDVPMDDEFLAEQERRRAKDLPDEIYDVTAWSLPLMFNVDVRACNRAVGGDFEAVDATRHRPGAMTGAGADVAFLVPWGTRAAVKLLASALRADLDVRSSDKPFTLGKRHYPAGTLIFKVDANPSDLPDRLSAWSRDTGAEVVGVSDSWVSDGPNFGSQNVVRVHPPRVALLWDLPTGTYAAGNTRFVIERQFGYPVSVIRGRSLGRADLDRYDVLILPDGGFWGSYGEVIGASGAERIARWVREGGTLITVGAALAFAADPEIGLVDLRREDAWRPEDEKPSDDDEDQTTVPGTRLDSSEDYQAAIQPEREEPDAVSGVLVRAEVDVDHCLGAGVRDTLHVLVRGDDVYSPLTLDAGRNVARFAAPDELLAAGYLWQENRRQLAFKPFVAVQPTGRGHVIAFTADPTYRAYLDGLNVIFMNAVFRGPAHARVVR